MIDGVQVVEDAGGQPLAYIAVGLRFADAVVDGKGAPVAQFGGIDYKRIVGTHAGSVGNVIADPFIAETKSVRHLVGQHGGQLKRMQARIGMAFAAEGEIYACRAEAQQNAPGVQHPATHPARREEAALLQPGRDVVPQERFELGGQSLRRECRIRGARYARPGSNDRCRGDVEFFADILHGKGLRIEAELALQRHATVVEPPQKQEEKNHSAEKCGKGKCGAFDLLQRRGSPFHQADGAAYHPKKKQGQHEIYDGKRQPGGPIVNDPADDRKQPPAVVLLHPFGLACGYPAQQQGYQAKAYPYFLSLLHIQDFKV